MARTYRAGAPRKGRATGPPRRENSARDWHQRRHVDERRAPPAGAMRDAQDRFDYLNQED